MKVSTDPVKSSAEYNSTCAIHTRDLLGWLLICIRLCL